MMSPHNRRDNLFSFTCVNVKALLAVWLIPVYKSKIRAITGTADLMDFPWLFSGWGEKPFSCPMWSCSQSTEAGA